jgi:DNA end-binding protein Ku
MVIDDALVLNLLRYPQEVVAADEFRLPDKPIADYRISDKELEMAEALLESMTVPWEPEHYEDQHRQRLQAIVDRRLAQKGGAEIVEEPDEVPQNAATNVVDFRKILQESLRKKGAAASDAAEEPASKKKKSPSSSKARKSPTKSAAKSKAKTSRTARSRKSGT